MNGNIFEDINRLLEDREVELSTLKDELLQLHGSEKLVEVAIDRGIEHGNIKASESGGNKRKISLEEPFQAKGKKNHPPILCLTLPPFDELGAQKKLEGEGIEFVPTKESFHDLIEEATNEIRVCSPFMEKRIWDLYHDELVKFAQKNGTIKVLTRELEKNRSKKIEIQKIIEDFEKKGVAENLQIADYYYSYSRKKLESSTHAKLFISDSSKAYVGSGEIRKNSLKTNFEVGVILTGEIVDSISLSFDYIFSVSNYLEGE